MPHHNDYINWPFLSEEEFELACIHLDQKYKEAKPEKTKFTFKLFHRRIASTGLSYIEILRLIQPPEDIDDLLNALEKLDFVGCSSQGSEPIIDYMVEDDDEKAPCLYHSPPKYCLNPSQPYVIYEVHLHPTYRVPTLWFTLHDLHLEQKSQDIELVYRYLVPTQYQSTLRSIGVIGGLSAAIHPVTNIPSFFVHPCQTKEAMEGFDCAINDYLMVWIGIVGGCVGLWLPPEMAQI